MPKYLELIMEASNTRNGGDGSSSSSHQLFEGKKFWLSQNIPQRSRFREMIQQHGGVIKLLEKDADIMLVDHTRRNLPDNSYSYKYVEQSIRNGRLENLEAHRAGPSPHRPEGATHIPRRTHRLPYTLEDDQCLWDFMQKYEQDRGATINGRMIYQKFADMYPRHTYQSYRDHYLKRLRGRPRPGGMPKPSEEKPAASGVNTGRRSPEFMPSTPNAERRRQISAGPSSSNQDGRKRKRTPNEEPPEGQISRKPDTPSQKRRTMNTSQDSTITSRQPQPDQPQRHPPARSPTRQVTIDPEPELHTIPDPTSNPEVEIDPLFLELPFLPSSPEPEEDVPAQDIDAWIDHRLRTGRAKTVEQVIDALRCASMDPDIADEVLRYLVAGKGIPADIPGVWTAEDDRCIEGMDAREVDRVLKKHGMQFVNIRWEYLGMARAAGFG